jgi:hypothetical protein
MVRTTVTLDPDVAQIVRRKMRERSMTFKDAINDAIRSGADRGAPRPAFRTATAALGVPTVDLDRALSIAAGLEDDDLIRKMRAGS